ncbi:hypothetical protein SAMN05444355_103128 [Flavobacterium frigoris]|uniref:Uncharacterized protein n=1 Tax=Flavobacterium frigoris TaxID=229204 RepID=A0A1H9HG44_FLAFI|nr:hypothetical protein SAMN05444355_103128 [Flavobacterium frigoris]
MPKFKDENTFGAKANSSLNTPSSSHKTSPANKDLRKNSLIADIFL